MSNENNVKGAHSCGFSGSLCSFMSKNGLSQGNFRPIFMPTYLQRSQGFPPSPVFLTPLCGVDRRVWVGRESLCQLLPLIQQQFDPQPSHLLHRRTPPMSLNTVRCFSALPVRKFSHLSDLSSSFGSKNPFTHISSGEWFSDICSYPFPQTPGWTVSPCCPYICLWF